MTSDTTGEPGEENPVPRKKPVRRVRVIEVIDEDGTALDDAAVEAVLAEADARDEAENEALGEPEEAAPVETVVVAKVSESKAAELKAGDSQAGDSQTEEPEAEEPASAGRGGPGRRGLPKINTVLVLSAAVVVFALLSSFALYKWQKLSGEADARRAVVSRVTEYGDQMATLGADQPNVSPTRSLAYLTGDALAEQKGGDPLVELQKTLVKNNVSIVSKTRGVYLNELNGNVASAVLVFDMKMTGPAGSTDVVTKGHFTFGLVKQDGVWMISSAESPGGKSAGGSLPGVPEPGASVSPTAKATPSRSAG